LTREEFKICFDQYFDPVRNYIYYRCGDTEIATDIVQEAFMKIWEKQLEYDPEKTKSLIYKIARELWISTHRKKQSSEKYQLQLSVKEDNNRPDQNLEHKELKEQYETVLSSLPEGQREVFLMSRLEDLTYKEIAERLSISVKAVEKRMSQTLKVLRNYLTHGK
jgi:RNA polymerase sigma-70 factor (family 1)